MIDLFTALPEWLLIAMIMLAFAGAIIGFYITLGVMADAYAKWWVVLLRALFTAVAICTLVFSCIGIERADTQKAEAAIHSSTEDVKRLCGDEAARNFNYARSLLTEEDEVKELFTEFVTDPQQCSR